MKSVTENKISHEPIIISRIPNIDQYTEIIKNGPKIKLPGLLHENPNNVISLNDLYNQMILPPPFVKREKPLNEAIIKGLSGPIRSKDGELLIQYLDYKNPTEDIIKSYNNWVFNIIQKQFDVRKIEIDNVVIKFENVKFRRSTCTLTSKVGDEIIEEQVECVPSIARAKGLNYTSILSIDLIMEIDGQVVKQEEIEIGQIPIMLGSKLDILYEMTDGKIQEKKDKILKQNNVDIEILSDIQKDNILRNMGIVVDDMSEEERDYVIEKMGETIGDPLGYFIINGGKKVLVMQDKLRKNKYIVYPEPKNGSECLMTCYTPLGTTVVRLVKGLNQMIGTYLRFMKDKNSLINIFVIYEYFKEEMNFHTVDDYINHILSFMSENPKVQTKARQYLDITKLEFLSIRDYDDVEINDPNDEYGTARIINKFDYYTATRSLLPEIEPFKDLIFRDLFPQIDSFLFPEIDKEDVIPMKINMFGEMISTYLNVLIGNAPVMDRDDLAHKRVNTAASLMEQLFGKVLATNYDNFRSSVINKYKSDYQLDNNIDEYIDHFFDSVHADARTTFHYFSVKFLKSFETHQWGVAIYDKKDGIVDTLNEESKAATLSHISRVNIPTNRQAKQFEIRDIHPSNFYYYCITENPDGDNCGLLRHKAVTTSISLERDYSVIYKKIKPYIKKYKPKNLNTTCSINGVFLGWCDPDKVFNLAKEFKFTEEYFDISVVHNNNRITINTESGRLVRPLLIVETEDGQNKGKLRLNIKNSSKFNFNELLKKRYLEYVDVEENVYIASTVKDIEEREQNYQDLIREHQKLLEKLNNETDQNVIDKINSEIIYSKFNIDRASRIKYYTHCELSPNAMFGISASLIPLADKNMGPRNTYQAGMNKQSVGIYRSSQTFSFDTSSRTLVYPTHPIFQTWSYNATGFNKNPAGQTAIVAFTSHVGGNVEDAIVMNKASIERGMFSMIIRKTFNAETATQNHTKQTGSTSSVLITFGKPSEKTTTKNISHIQDNGLPIIGTYIKQDDCIIGMVSKEIVKGEQVDRDNSVYAREGDSGFVEDVIKTKTGSGKTVVRVTLRQFKVPQYGDKYAARYSQKGVVGKIETPENMPWTVSDGSSPDIIFNMLGIPTRMTVGYLIELIASKGALVNGRIVDASSFGDVNYDNIKRVLRNYGYDEWGSEVTMSGLFGGKKKGKIFMGPVHYLALKHLSYLKIQGVGISTKHAMVSRSPMGGKKKGAAQRFGEMECGAVVSFGAAHLFTERLCFSSDAYNMIICKSCSSRASYKKNIENFQCDLCGSHDLGRILIPYSAKLIIDILFAMGINMNFGIRGLLDSSLNENDVQMQYDDDLDFFDIEFDEEL